MVSMVYDEYLDVFALGPTVYTLNLTNSIVAYSDSGLTETAIRVYMSHLCMGLMSLVRIMGVLSIYSCPSRVPRGDARQ